MKLESSSLPMGTDAVRAEWFRPTQIWTYYFVRLKNVKQHTPQLSLRTYLRLTSSGLSLPSRFFCRHQRWHLTGRGRRGWCMIYTPPKTSRSRRWWGTSVPRRTSRRGMFFTDNRDHLRQTTMIMPSVTLTYLDRLFLNQAFSLHFFSAELTITWKS